MWKREPPSPHGPNLGPYAPLRFGYLRLGSVRFGYVRLCWVMLGSVPPETPLKSNFRVELSSISIEIIGFAQSVLQIHWKSLVSHTAFLNFTGNRLFRIQLSAIALETYGFAYSVLQLHWQSMVSNTAFWNVTGNRWLRIQLSAISLEINGFAYSLL